MCLKRSAATELLLPLSGRKVSLALSHLAAHGVWSMGAAAPRQGVRRFRLIGWPSWYQARVLRNAGRYLEGALLPSPVRLESPEVSALREAMEPQNREKVSMLSLFLVELIHLANQALRAQRELPTLSLPSIFLEQPLAARYRRSTGANRSFSSASSLLRSTKVPFDLNPLQRLTAHKLSR